MFSALLRALEVLARSELSESQHKVLANARCASQVSVQMLNTLLDFSRIEAGVVEPQRQSFHLQPLLHKPLSPSKLYWLLNNIVDSPPDQFSEVNNSPRPLACEHAGH